MSNIKPTVVDVEKVMPLSFGEKYDSRMILDHVITGRDNGCTCREFGQYVMDTVESL